MDYLFTQEDTALAFCLLVSSGFAFIQLQKNVISSHVDQFTLPRRKLFLTTGVCLIVPLWWVVKLLTYVI